MRTGLKVLQEGKRERDRGGRGGRETDRLTDRQTSRQTDRDKDRDRQTGTHTSRETARDRQTDRDLKLHLQQNKSTTNKDSLPSSRTTAQVTVSYRSTTLLHVKGEVFDQSSHPRRHHLWVPHQPTLCSVIDSHLLW